MYFRDVQDSALFTSVIFSILSNLRQYSLRFIQIMFSLSYSLQLWSVFYPHLFQWYSVFRSIYFNSVQYSAPLNSMMFSIVSHLIQYCSVFHPIYFSEVQFSILIYFSDVQYSDLIYFIDFQDSVPFISVVFTILSHLLQRFSVFPTYLF